MASIIRIISMGGTREVNLDSMGKDVVSFGRTHECDIQLREEYVSRLHGCFYKENGAWYFKDMESTNGIYFHGVKTDSAPLRNDDEIVIHKKDSLTEAVKMVFIRDDSVPSMEDWELQQMQQINQMNQVQQMDQLRQQNQMQLQQQQMNQMSQMNQAQLQEQQLRPVNPVPQVQPQQSYQAGPQMPNVSRPRPQRVPEPQLEYDDDDDDDDEFSSDKTFLVVGIIVVMLLLIAGLILFLKIFNSDDTKQTTTAKKTVEATTETTKEIKDDSQSVDTVTSPETTEKKEEETTESTTEEEYTGDGSMDQGVEDLSGD